MNLELLKDNGTFNLHITSTDVEVIWLGDEGAKVGGIVGVFKAHNDKIDDPIEECENWVSANNLHLSQKRYI